MQEYEKEVAQLAKQNPKEFCKHVNSKLKTRTRIADLTTIDDQVISDDMEKAQKFNEFFGSVCAMEDLDGIPEVTSQEPTMHQGLSSVEIDETEIMDLLKRLQIDKSSGPDGSHPRVLKECATEIVHLLMVLFRSSLRRGRLP